jgi:hypothetical protein
MSRKVGDALSAFLEPFVVPDGVFFGVKPGPPSKEGRCALPLGDDDTALSPLDAPPHTPALLEVLCSSVDRVQRRRLALAPVGD